MKIIKNDKNEAFENYLEFTLKNDQDQDQDQDLIHFSIINSLRRVMISNVETLAIETAKIIENNSIVPDDMIAHRIGLIPLKRNNNFINKCHFSLDVSFNLDDNSDIQTIYSKDLISKNSDVSLVYDDIIIAIIKKNQRIKLEAEAILGTGSIHAKWCPSTGTSYEENDDGSYTFFIETVGSVGPKELFLESINVLKEKLLNLKVL